MRRLAHINNRGLTLTELLVVMLIIGLLSTIAVPVYINRMEDARVRMCQAEEREIATAEESCALIHGFYVPFQVLDDRPDIPGITSSGDTIGQDFTSSIFLINPLIAPQDEIGNQYVLSDATNPRVSTMLTHWEGPFLNPHRVYVGSQDPNDINFYTTAEAHLDFPLDPWGQPYRFYSPLGVIGTSALTTQFTNNLSVSFSNGVLTSNDNRNLERYAVMSYGRDNLPETGAGGGGTPAGNDDIIYLFGSAGIESDFGVRN